MVLSADTQTQETENKYKGLYLWVMLDTELRKLSIFFDTSSMPFLKKPICNIKAMKELCNNCHIDLLFGPKHTSPKLSR